MRRAVLLAVSYLPGVAVDKATVRTDHLVGEFVFDVRHGGKGIWL